ncbi:MAG: hypothetical protein ACM3RP_02550, partial [Chitinophagales bacterium]
EIRNLRAEYQVPQGKGVPALVRAGAAVRELFEKSRPFLLPLANLTELTLLAEDAAAPEQAVTAVAGGAELFLPLAGLVDVERERDRLGKELAAAVAEVERLTAKLGNPGFTGKAPAEVIEKERAKLVAAEERLTKAKSLLADLDRLAGGK